MLRSLGRSDKNYIDVLTCFLGHPFNKRGTPFCRPDRTATPRRSTPSGSECWEGSEPGSLPCARQQGNTFRENKYKVDNAMVTSAPLDLPGIITNISSQFTTRSTITVYFIGFDARVRRPKRCPSRTQKSKRLHRRHNDAQRTSVTTSE